MIRSERIGDVAVLELAEELTVANRDALSAEVSRRLTGGDRKFVIDLGRTRFVDSAGLGTLVDLGRRIREAGGELRLTGMDERIRTLFALTRLDALFQISATRGAALTEL